MNTIRNTFMAMMVALSGLLAATASSNASAFFAWQVTNVEHWDTLNVRAYPSSQSQILVAYPNGTPLSLTGVCTDSLNLNQISGLPTWTQRQHVRYRWCQTWIDPHGNGQFQSAWVYGRYISPTSP